MTKANMDVRTALKTARIPIWVCAAEMGVCENTLARKLRMELPEAEKKSVFTAIERIKAKERT